MSELVSNDLFDKAMKANNLEFEEKNKELKIKKSKERNTSIQSYIGLSIAGIVLGLFLVILSGRIGIAIIGLSGAVLFATVNLREREKESERKSIKVGTERIEIREGYKTRRVNLGEISEFKTDVERYKNLFVGNIAIITEDRRNYEFLEIFGNNEELVQDDLLIISNYIIDNYISNSEDVEI